MVAIVEHGGFGGKHAAPIAFAAIQAYQQFVRSRPGASANRGGAPDKGKGKAPARKGGGGAP